MSFSFFGALDSVEVKLPEGRAPSRIVSKTCNFRLEVVYY